MHTSTPSPASDTGHAESELEALRAQVAHLEIALTTSRQIGMAVGIVMERRKVAADDAFGLLVDISQHTHAKLRDIASELVYSGTLPRPH